MSVTEANVTRSSAKDPFNWPSLNRKDLMSATGGLASGKDLDSMIKPHLRPKTRQESSNLKNDDIDGKLQPLPTNLYKIAEVSFANI